MLNFIKNISPIELIIIAAILIILFGSKILISLARTSGETIKEIKKIKGSITEVIEDTGREPQKNEREV